MNGRLKTLRFRFAIVVIAPFFVAAVVLVGMAFAMRQMLHLAREDARMAWLEVLEVWNHGPFERGTHERDYAERHRDN